MLSHKPHSARTFTEKFYYPTGGIGRIPERMTAGN